MASNSSISIAVFPGNSIQNAINTVNTNGGGEVILINGTHTPGADITLYSGVTLQGESELSSILDFGAGAYGIKLTGTNVYSTGTIASISGGVNVVGSGTSWNGTVLPGMSLLLANRWYIIAAVTDNTHLILAEGYQGNATLPSSYVIGYPVQEANISNLTVQNSTATLIDANYVRNCSFLNLTVLQGSIGISIQNFTEIVTNTVVIAANSGNGIVLSNGSLSNFGSTAVSGNGGAGWVVDSTDAYAIVISQATGNTGNGLTISNSNNIFIQMLFEGNGGIGASIDDCVGLTMSGSQATANAGDGVKFLNNSSENQFAICRFTDNGGYGLNITASTAVENIFIGCFFDNNSSGNYIDGGTGTIIADSVGANTLLSSADLAAQSAAVSSVVAVTAPNDGAAHTYSAGGYIAVTAISVNTITLQVTFTDENSNSQTKSFFAQGLTTAAVSTTGFFNFPPMTLRCAPNTAVTIKTSVVGVGSETYDVGGYIQKIN